MEESRRSQAVDWQVAKAAPDWQSRYLGWLRNDYVRRGGGELLPKTLASYGQDLRHLATWFGRAHRRPFSPEELTPEIVRQYFHAQAEEKSKPASSNRRLASLRVFVKWATGAGFLGDDPTIRQRAVVELRLPRRAKDPKELAAVEAVAEAGSHVKHQTAKHRWLAERDLVIWKWFVETGQRISSLAALDIADIDLVERTFSVMEKGGVIVHEPITLELLSALLRWLPVHGGAGPALICDWDGTRLSTGQIRRRLEMMTKKAGVRMKPHDLRHTYVGGVVFEALQSGMPMDRALDIAMQLAGHRDRRSVMGYLRATTDDLAKVNDAASRRRRANVATAQGPTPTTSKEENQ